MADHSVDVTAEASDTDLAEQALPVEDTDDEPEPFSAAAEADPADVLEQQRSVPSGDDDYDR